MSPAIRRERDRKPLEFGPRGVVSTGTVKCSNCGKIFPISGRDYWRRLSSFRYFCGNRCRLDYRKRGGLDYNARTERSL